MITVIRAALIAAAVSLAAALPAAAQQAADTAAPAATAPATEAPAAAGEAPADARIPADLDAMVQRLKNDLQSLTDAAQQGVHSVLTRESPYVITTDQLAMLAAGAVAGAIVVDMLGGGGLATLTGAAVGSVAVHWFYTQPDPLAVPGLTDGIGKLGG